MPRVTFLPGPDPLQSKGDLRAAIRALREQGQDVRDVELIQGGLYAHQAQWFGQYRVGSGQIRLTNNVQGWEADVRGLQRFLDQWQATTGYAAPPMCWPGSPDEFLADTLAHEYGHKRSVEKVGNPLAPGFDWKDHLPSDLYVEIDWALKLEKIDPASYNRKVAEVLAEDMRRYLSGRDSYFNVETRKADLDDWARAWRRVREVAKWLGV